MTNQTSRRICSELIIEFNATSPHQALRIAASNPENWKLVDHKANPDGWQLKSDIASEQIDAAMMSVIDLTPDRFSWNALALCEKLITCETETQEHLDAMLSILDLVPIALRQEAVINIHRLMLIAGRKVISMNPPSCAERRTALYFGWISI